jgi:hypothetical protein
MKFYKRLNLYKCSNLQYNLETEQAYSYEWYCIAKRFGKVMVVNSYPFSPTTQRHAYKIRSLFDELNIQYEEISAPKGLQSLDLALNYYQNCIQREREAIAKPRSRELTNIEREKTIKYCQSRIKLIQQFISED